MYCFLSFCIFICHYVFRWILAISTRSLCLCDLEELQHTGLCLWRCPKEAPGQWVPGGWEVFEELSSWGLVWVICAIRIFQVSFFGTQGCCSTEDILRRCTSENTICSCWSLEVMISDQPFVSIGQSFLEEHCKNCERCPTHVSWKVNFKCQSCVSCLSCPAVWLVCGVSL